VCRFAVPSSLRFVMVGAYKTVGHGHACCLPVESACRYGEFSHMLMAGSASRASEEELRHAIERPMPNGGSQIAMTIL